MRWNPAIYYLGSTLRLPFGATKAISDLRDIGPHARSYLDRARAARRMQCAVELEDGYRFLTGWPETDGLLAAAREVAQGAPDARGTPYVNILTADCLRRFPVFLEVATGHRLVSTVARYLGAVPQLRYLELWRSTPVLSQPAGSMLYHLDVIDAGVISLFVNVNDLTERSGPTRFIPGRASDRLRKRVRYNTRYVRGLAALDDAEIDGQPIVSMAGPAGTTALVDTSRCFHQGGRCEEGERLLLVMKYNRSFKMALPSGSNLAPFVNAPGCSDVLCWHDKDPEDDVRHPLRS